MLRYCMILLAVLLLGAASPAANAAGVEGQMFTIATFDIGVSNYVELSVVGEAINKKFGAKFRLIPLGNTVARVTALRAGRTMFWQTCSGHYSSFEGLDDFATENWGPQPIQMLWVSNRIANYSFAATKKSGITNMKDLKGKRVAYIVGIPSINMQAEAYLAFAGLTWNDVKKVEFPGYPASMRGMIADSVDAAMVANSSPIAFEIAASPQGMTWLPLPHADKEGWARAQAICSFVAPITIAEGAGVAKGQKIEVGSYPCPIMLALDSQDEKIVATMTKMIAEAGPDFKDAMAAGPYWQIDEMLKSRFVVPFHKGAVSYFKEKGKWTAEHEKQQEYLLKRQKVLLDAFAAVKKANPDKKGEAFAAIWLPARLDALKKAGLPLY